MNPSPSPAPFTSAHVRASILKVLLVVGAVVSGMTLLAEVMSFPFPIPTEEQELGDNPMGAAVMFVTLLLALLGVLIYLTTVVFFLMWLYRAANNVRHFDPWRRLEHSPGWAVGSFFIPIVNLFVPYRAVKEVWQKSGPPGEAVLAEPSPPAFFPIWWLFWLLSCFADNISMRATFNENVPESTATMISIVANALSVVAAVFAYLVVHAVDKRQEETVETMKLGNFSPPPPPPTNIPMPEVVAPNI